MRFNTQCATVGWFVLNCVRVAGDFNARALCFYYVAEGSNFLKRGSTHPPSFPMFHSPPSWKWSSIKADVHSNFFKEISSFICFLGSVLLLKTADHPPPFHQVWLFLDAFTAKSLGHVDGATHRFFNCCPGAEVGCINNLPSNSDCYYNYYCYLHFFFFLVYFFILKEKDLFLFFLVFVLRRRRWL